MRLGWALLLLSACSHQASRHSASVSLHAFADDRAFCFQTTDRVSPAQQTVIDTVMAQHQHRLNHMLWHSTREAWEQLSWADQALLQRIDPSWGRHAPLCPGPMVDDGNTAGEEFLLMHHQMVEQFRAELTARQLPCVAGWKSIPAASDAAWPVPPGDDPSKSDFTERLLRDWETTFSDPDFLRAHSLSQLGYLVEISAHNNLHKRWATVPTDADRFSPATPGFTQSSLLAPSVFDDPRFRWLGNPYHSHVNPVFWKLHGWVDGLVVKWLAANGYKTIAGACGGRVDCYEWKTRWVGATHAEHRGPSSARFPASPADREAAGRVMGKLLSRGFFGGDAFAKYQRSLGVLQDAATNELSDPEVYVKRFGPCSGNAPR